MFIMLHCLTWLAEPQQYADVEVKAGEYSYIAGNDPRVLNIPLVTLTPLSFEL